MASDSMEFLNAVQKRDGNKAAQLITDHPTIIDARDDRGDTALIIAINRGDSDWTGFLLNKGADPNLPGARGDTPLIAAARIGFEDAAEWLLSLGAKVDGTVQQVGKPVCRPCHIAGVCIGPVGSDLQAVPVGQLSDMRHLRRRGFRRQMVASPQLHAARIGIEQRHQFLKTDLTLDSLWINGDAFRLEQVFANLLSNASKYSPEGAEISVSARAADQRAMAFIQFGRSDRVQGRSNRLNVTAPTLTCPRIVC
jgi:hypothetical protein